MFDRLSDGLAAALAVAGLAIGLVGVVGAGYEAYLVAPRLTAAGLLVLALTMQVVGATWLANQAPGTPFHEMAMPVAVATTMPLLVGTLVSFNFPGRTDTLAWLLGAAAAANLGLRLADTLPQQQRTTVSLVTALLAVSAAPLGILAPSISYDGRGVIGTFAVLLMAATTVVPGLLSGIVRHAATGGATRAAVVASLELGVIGITPAIAVVTVWGQGVSPWTAVPVVAWIMAVIAAQYFAVRPLARNATAATVQRDQVVAAMEAERSRIAADIHDDALQELTLLGWRLDAAGDRDGAQTAREVSDRLRAILGDLRLPILDDLGCGPALEWLVERVGRLAGGEVRLERADSVRPPAEVELGFFRVAQEALSNAVRHGRPPIVVRYWASPSGASLSIDDAGPGIDPRAAQGVAAGHFGLLNMRQRAEQIGALLDVRPWPGGGTRVTLEWRA